MENRTSTATLAFVCFTSCAHAALIPPEGWRFPTSKELSGVERQNSSDRYARAVADFNGDRIADEAFLLKDARGSGEGLWVSLSHKDRVHSWLLLDKTDWGQQHPNVDVNMALDVLKPGTHKYMCFDSSADCDAGEPEKRPTLNVATPAILYFQFESAASFFFWDEKQQIFRRVWVSD
jgi:hypothetical protein